MPDAVAGHSVGAFAAAVAADALDFEDALRLVDFRARVMEAEFPAAYRMGVVNGLSESDVRAIVARVSTARAPLYTASVNSYAQIAIAGTAASVAQALDLVHVPSLTPLMDDVARRLAGACAAITLRVPRVPIATNIDARLTRDAEHVRNDLAASVARPVRWADATRALYERGVRCFLEMLPGHVLADLAAVAFEDARAAAVETVGVASAIALATRVVG